MREYSVRQSSNKERGEFRPGHGKGKSSGPRSKRAGNLGKLGDVLGLDLLAAALGLSDEALSILVEGRDHAREEQYAAHLAARFKEAGIPASWLDKQYAPLAPDHLFTLRKLAAASRNKAPTRRANFRRIAAAFDGREEVLADALELVPSAVTNIAEGRLEFDDGRFGHMNPRLMRAGFPDGWLELAEPELSDDMVQRLEYVATDEYERRFEEEASAPPAQAFVNPAPAAEEQKSLQPVAAPVDTSKETVMATANPPKLPAQQTPPAAPQFKAGGMPNAAKPMAHPTAGASAAKLPRSVLAAGRKLGGTPASAPAAKQASAPAAPAPTRAPAPQQAAAKSTSKAKTGAGSKTSAGTQAAATERRTLAPRSTVSKEVSVARAEALEKLLSDPSTRRGVKVTLWRDILGSSLPFWGNIRRGAVLFRDDLAEGAIQALGLPEGWLDNPSFPPATLAAWVTDKDAPVPGKLAIAGDDAEQAAGDTPEGGAQQALPLAGDEAASSEAQGDAAKPAPQRNVVKPFARKTAPAAPKVTMTKAPTSAPVFPGASAAAQSAQAAGTPAATPAPAPAATPATPAATSSAPAPAATPAAAPVMSAGASADAGPFAAAGELLQATSQPAARSTPSPVVASPGVGLTPAGGAVPGQPGPLVQALLSIITAKAASGTFSETDALELINKMMTH